MAWRREQPGDEDRLPVRLRRLDPQREGIDIADPASRYFGVIGWLRDRETALLAQGLSRTEARRLARAEQSWRDVLRGRQR